MKKMQCKCMKFVVSGEPFIFLDFPRKITHNIQQERMLNNRQIRRYEFAIFGHEINPELRQCRETVTLYCMCDPRGNVRDGGAEIQANISKTTTNA